MSRPPHPIRVASLFAGIEGLGLGFDAQVGAEIVWQCEIDPDARAVLEAHFPTVARYGDVREIHAVAACPTPGGTCERCVPDVDVLIGGFPCQDISVAGRRAGLAGQRSGLFHEFMRLVAELAPRWVLIENVPGLLSSGHRPDCAGFVMPSESPDGQGAACTSCAPGADMETVLGTLADLGYGWAYRVLDAQYFGVAQRRRRVFIVGCLGNPAGAAKVLFEPESCDGDPAPSRETRARVAASLTAGVASGSGVNNPGRRGEDDINLVTDEVAMCLRAKANSAHAEDLETYIPEVVSTLEGGGRRGYRVGSEEAAGGQLIPTDPTAVDMRNGEMNGEVSHSLQAQHPSPNSVPHVMIPEVTHPVTSKWAKGTGGPAGDEAQNLVPTEMRLYRSSPEFGQGADLVVRGMDSDEPHPTLTSNAGQYIGDRGVLVVDEATAYDDLNQSVTGDVTHTLRVNDPYGPILFDSSDDSPPPSAVFIKAQRAHDPDDCERWEDADSSLTLDASGLAARTATAVIAPTLTAANDPSRPPQSTEVTAQVQAVLEAHSIAVRGRDDGQEWELGDPGVGNALRAGDGGSSRGNWALTPQMAVRRLTPTECERLQGFADGWTEGRSDSARYRLLGNAVCVSVSRWIATRVVGVDRVLPVAPPR